MFDKNFFCNQLKSLRKELKLSQEAFGAKFGVFKSAVSMIEKGERTTSLELLATICDTFNVTPDYFLGRGIFAKLDLVEECFDTLSNAACSLYKDPAVKEKFVSLPHYQQLCFLNSLIENIELVDNRLNIYWRF